MVAVVGDAVTEFPLRLPGIQLYVAAPFPFSVTGEPEHTVVCEALADTVGTGLTVRFTKSVLPAHALAAETTSTWYEAVESA